MTRPRRPMNARTLSTCFSLRFFHDGRIVSTASGQRREEGGLAEGVEFPLLRTESPTFPRGWLMIVGVQLPPAQQVVPRGFDVFSGSGRGGKARIPEELHALPKLEAVLGSGRLQARRVVSPWVALTVTFAALGLAAPAGS
jgi:hypothetical protein